MKNLILVGALSLLAQLTPNAFAKLFDGGVDSENLGKGNWIFIVGNATNKVGGMVPSVLDIPSLMSYLKNQGINYVIVKAGTGSTNYNGTGSSPQFTSNLVFQAHQVGVKIFAYTRSYGDDVPGEINMAINCFNMGADGFVIDGESEWESGHQGSQGPAKAIQLCQGIKAAFPNRFLGHSPFPYISLHSSFPYEEFGYYCDAVMPQCYWDALGITPAQMVDDLRSEWTTWQNTLSGQWTNSLKPIVPIGEADTSTISFAQITNFVNLLATDLNPATAGGYKGINWWRCELHLTNTHWPAIAATTLGDPPAVPDIVIDNPQATVVGTWTPSTSAVNKFGTNYIFRGQGTGANFVDFIPDIQTPGTYRVYEWHPSGGNRSSNAPVTITHAAGSTTVGVNQKISGATWVLLGAFNFDAGTAGKVRIADNFPDAGQIVTADAVRFSFLPPAPAAPSGLAAVAIAGPAINLTWTDNSTNEGNFIIARGTTPGGPYSSIATISSGATSYSDAAVAASTTYYYVVRAIGEGGSSANSNEASATSLNEVADIIIDNPSAVIVGTWSIGTGAGKFGADYRFEGQGTGGSHLTYTPSIFTPGNYQVFEWHPAGSNRTIAAPHIITHTNGSTTIFVNQQIAGGAWNSLGTFGFAAGTVGKVRITDNFSDTGHIVIADAIKFSFIPPPPLPAAPSALAAIALSPSQINLSWTDNSTNENNFVVGRGTTPGGPYTDIATLPANSTAFSDGGLSGGTTYYYVVRAVNVSGSSANSNEASATTPPNAPAAPSDLTTTTISQTQIDLSWVDNSSNEDNFVVARGDVSGGPYTDIVTLPANTTTHSDTGLTDSTTYYYFVRAVNATGYASTPEVSGTTLPFPPAAPSGLAAVAVSQTQINLSWTDNANNEGSMFVARSDTAGGPYSDIALLPANSTSFSDTTLSAATTYYYVVRAANAGGSSANSNEASATTLPNPPTAPSGLAATTVSQTQINLSWTDNANNEDNMIVARSTSAGGPYTDIATLPANTTSFNNTGLSSETTYYYVVRAANAGGSSANSNEASGTTLPFPPVAPSTLLATAYRATQINLTWADNSSNEATFIVGRSSVSGGPYSDIATLPANSTAYSDTGLSTNTTYYYVVRAQNAGGSSTNSAQASTTTFETDLLIDNKSAVIIGSWSVGSSSTDKYSTDYRFKGQGTGTSYLQFTPYVAVAGIYVVYEWHPQGANRPTNAPHVITYNGGSTNVTINQQINGGKWNVLGTFNFSAGSSGNIKITDNFAGTNVVMADAIKLVFFAPPNPPSGLTATAVSQSQINLSWTDNSTNENNFIVARSTVSGGPYTDIATLPPNTTSFNNTNLTFGTTYYYVVRAVNDGGTSANSAQASATTFTPPLAPTNLIATNKNPGQIHLSWLDNSSNETNFVVARSLIGGGPYTDIASLPANSTNYVDTGLNNGTTYYYVVRAQGATGVSPNSNQASATTMPSPPSPPGGLTATAVSSTQINLAWTDNSPNEEAFIVARSLVNGGPYTDIATLPTGTVSYSNTNLTPNTTYYYVVRAVNGGGASPNSNQASATTFQTPPAAPSGLTALALSSSSIKLTWVDNSSNENNFIVGRSTTSGGPYTDIATLGINVTTYTNTGLAQNTTYYYVVRASNGAGSSANSAQASATTFPTIPAAPSGLTATALTNTVIKLTWVDNSSNETNFIVARSTTSGGPYTDIATVGANITTYTNTGLNPSTTYYFVVRASNAGGSSGNSNQASATTPGIADIIIDNPAATITGTWTLGTSATDKFGADYRSRGQGTGANFLTYRPTILVAGNYQVYEWHSQGSNRTTNAPIVISFNGGVVTNFVNQKISGGQWVTVGTPRNFLVGTNGTVKITDKFPDAGQTVIADAVKLVFVP